MRAWESAKRSASFSGLGGIGGGATLGVDVGKGVSKGEVRRSSADFEVGICG